MLGVTPVARDAHLPEVLHLGPPGPVQVVHVVLLAELLQGPPILVRYAEPLGVAGPDVQVDGSEVVVLLVPGRPGLGHLQNVSLFFLFFCRLACLFVSLFVSLFVCKFVSL